MSAIQRIATRETELGAGLSIRRALPTRHRRMVGAWCFLDHIGPIDFAPDAGLHVGAHPHIGLQTFTWPVAGEILHRDSLGNEQLIRPGQVNLMTAGHGIAHTEDSPQAEVKFLVAGFLSRIPEVKVWVDIKEVDANTTLVSVKYDHSMSGAWKAWADAVPYFAENEYSGCPMVTNNPYKPVMPPKP